MNILVHGYDLDRPNDPWVIVTTLQEVQASVPLSREGVEDLEAAVFVEVLLYNWRTEGRTWVEPNADDPPDFFLHYAGERWGLELTKLTVHDVRAEIARARRFVTTIREGVSGDASKYAHLQSRIINLNLTADLPAKPKDLEALTDAVLERLSDDQGVMQPLDPNGPMPQTLPPDGFYGDVGPINITEAEVAAPGIHVAAHVQARIYAAEAIALIEGIVEAKDVAGNDVLAIAAGFPDQSGFACAADSGLIDLIRKGIEAGQLASLKPQHLKLVVLHGPMVPPLVLYHDKNGFPLP